MWQFGCAILILAFWKCSTGQMMGKQNLCWYLILPFYHTHHKNLVHTKICLPVFQDLLGSGCEVAGTGSVRSLVVYYYYYLSHCYSIIHSMGQIIRSLVWCLCVCLSVLSCVAILNQFGTDIRYLKRKNPFVGGQNPLRVSPIFIAGFLCSWVTPPLFNSNFGVFPLHQIEIVHVRVSPHIGLKPFGCGIIFEEFQPMWSWYLNVMDGQTDNWLWECGITAVCVASHGKKLGFWALHLAGQNGFHFLSFSKF